jgi:hypothetical protein
MMRLCTSRAYVPEASGQPRAVSPRGARIPDGECFTEECRSSPTVAVPSLVAVLLASPSGPPMPDDTRRAPLPQRPSGRSSRPEGERSRPKRPFLRSRWGHAGPSAEPDETTASP